ncbi:NAD(P)-dependent oxidoreductase [Nitrobacter sp. 62-13]|uniref:NAD-dependent epimerase/dehydratase family protein n=1 Tax=Nitrobacter sp. 62-13 TaxID=1895797 RepID=UPI000A6748B2|nr:NAD(P)-dependent oxidoreductase [Nitrobacter sp. 62-13]
MRIFVAGATGAVGRRLVPRLINRGHSVTGLTRTPAKTNLLRKFGADPVVADALDEKAIHAAVVAARPDVIVHQLTDLKDASDLRNFDRTFASSNRLRTAGTDHLVAAAQACGVKRMVAQSFCGWPYARTGGHVKTEDDPLDQDPPRELRGTLDAIRHLEHAVTTTPGLVGVALRYGGFYGPDTGFCDPSILKQIRKRRMPPKRLRLRSSAVRAFTTSSTMIRRRCVTGSWRSRGCWGQNRRSAFPPGWAALSPDNISLS